MKTPSCTNARLSERGVALLIAIFSLLLISGVAISLVVMSGTESAVGANYRGSTQAFYAGVAGIEEARGRLRRAHPDTIDVAMGINLGASVVPLNRVYYLLNPAAGEVVNPADASPSNPYRDAEYQREFGVPVSAATVQSIASTSGALGGVPGPLFKWVRITAKSERAAGHDINGDGVINNAIPVFYDGQRQNLIASGRQVFRATALAVLPDGSRRLVQYDVSPTQLNLNVPAALTFDGQGSALFPANSDVYHVDGNDHAGCGRASSDPPRPAIGVLTPADDLTITTSIPRNRTKNYEGSGPSPDVQDVSGGLPANLQSVEALEELIQEVKENATQVVQGPATSLSTYGTASVPTITYVEGDLDLQGDITGYGILVVTGKYSAGGTVGWKGIVLVVGEGIMAVEGGGKNQYDGAVLLANTRNPDGTLRTSLGPTLLDWSGGGGNGIYFSSGCIQNAGRNTTYRVLSFREIPD